MEKGTHHTIESLKRLRDSHLGKKHREESKMKLLGNKNALGNKAMLGKKHSPETIQKIIETKRKNPYHHTLEAKRKIGESGKGRVGWNKGLIGKDNPLYGRRHSEESKKKMSEQIQKYYASHGGTHPPELIAKLKKSAKERIAKGIALPPSRKGCIVPEEKRRKISGENSWNWKGGKSLYDFEFRNIRKSILLRDALMCQGCGMLSEDNKKLFGCSLAVHHINYDRTLSIPENSISLCERCHAKTKGNRESWKAFYQKMLSEKYGYKYDENGNVIIQLEIAEKSQ